MRVFQSLQHKADFPPAVAILTRDTLSRIRVRSLIHFQFHIFLKIYSSRIRQVEIAFRFWLGLMLNDLCSMTYAR